MDSELEANQSGYENISLHLDRWKTNIKNAGPGTIDLELDNILQSSLTYSQLLSLLAAVNDRLRSFHEVVPAIVLQTRCPVEGVRFVDYSVTVLASVIAEMRTLLGQTL
jgi:hypothetical protein